MKECTLKNISDAKEELRKTGNVGERKEACDFDSRRPWEKSYHYYVYLHETVSKEPYPLEFVQRNFNKMVLCPNYIAYRDKNERDEEGGVKIKKQVPSFDNYDYKFFAKSNKKIGIKNKIKIIKDFPDNIMCRVLIVSGGTGVGKSYLAKCLQKQEQEKGRAFVFIKWLELIDKFRDIGKDKDGYTDRFFFDVDILALDDFGEEEQKESGWTEEKLKALLDSFHQNQKPKKLVITTNKDMVYLIEKYTDKLMGRILKDCQEVEIFGGNYNLKNYIKNQEE